MVESTFFLPREPTVTILFVLECNLLKMQELPVAHDIYLFRYRATQHTIFKHLTDLYLSYLKFSITNHHVAHTKSCKTFNALSVWRIIRMSEAEEQLIKMT